MSANRLPTDLAIVLTGTIVPNAPFTAHSDPQIRRREYLEAINFYRKFATVYFLENSTYALEDDAEFNKLSNVLIRKCPVSSSPERGKGYQEFEMIDCWLLSESELPLRWIKITGRYLYRNFSDLFENCCQQRQAQIIIDRCAFSQIARSYLFCVESEFYQQHIAGLYRECNDETGEWVERVLYRRLASLSKADARLFSLEPRLTGISGTTGGSIETQSSRYQVKRILRKLNYLLNCRQLWYTR